MPLGDNLSCAALVSQQFILTTKITLNLVHNYTHELWFHFRCTISQSHEPYSIIIGGKGHLRAIRSMSILHLAVITQVGFSTLMS